MDVRRRAITRRPLCGQGGRSEHWGSRDTEVEVVSRLGGKSSRFISPSALSSAKETLMLLIRICRSCWLHWQNRSRYSYLETVDTRVDVASIARLDR